MITIYITCDNLLPHCFAQHFLDKRQVRDSLLGRINPRTEVTSWTEGDYFSEPSIINFTVYGSAHEI